MVDRVIGINEIKEIVPFRPPYLMVDRAVIHGSGDEISGVKAVSGNEVVFCGHFPEQAIMPGVLQVEALTQLGLIAARHKSKYAFVRQASRVKFRSPVVPGDILEMNAQIKEQTDDQIVLKATAKVDGNVTCQGNLTIELIDDDSCFQPRELYPKGKFSPDCEALSLETIRGIIPHRFPFQLVDRAFPIGHNEQGQPEIIGIKNVTFNEPYFASIKNEMPFMPNYLLMEVVAQIGCISKLSEPESVGKLGLYLGVDKATFHKPVLPGDKIMVYAVEESFKMGFGKSRADVYVGQDAIANIQFKFALAEKQ